MNYIKKYWMQGIVGVALLVVVLIGVGSQACLLYTSRCV